MTAMSASSWAVACALAGGLDRSGERIVTLGGTKRPA